MAMTNLFKKFSTVSTTAIAVFCAFACSDKIAGTAEEPNQFAYGSSSSQDDEYSANMPPSSSSANNLDGHSTPSGASSSNSNTAIPITSSSRDPIVIGGNGNPGHNGGFGNSEICYTSDGEKMLCGPSGSDTPTLDDLLKKYNITDATFDNNVLAYNKTFQSCYESTGNCSDIQAIADLRTIGLHKFTKENVTGIAYLFTNYAKTVYTIYGTDNEITIGENGCPLYVLNIHDTSPTIHVLTNITKDTIAITDFSDKCDYEPRPFEMHVGYLIAYCGELSENPAIKQTFKQLDTADCSDVTYEEYIKKN